MTWSRKALLAALLVIAPAVTSCSERQDPTLPPSQVVSGPQEGLIGDVLGGLVGGLVNVVGGVVDGVLNVLSGPDANGAVAREWIDSDGGTISVAAYKLIVPRNAVSQNTLFELKPANDGTYKVELSAFRRSSNGSLVEVGHYGFNRPVLFIVSFANARGVVDPRDLFIAYLRDDGKAEIQPGLVDLYRKTVNSPLGHFSKYALAQD